MKMLMNALSNAGVSFQQHRSFTKKELQEFARIRGLNFLRKKQKIAGMARSGFVDSGRLLGDIMAIR